MAAVTTAGAGKSVGQDAAFQKAPQFALCMRGHLLLPPLVSTAREEGLQMVLYYPIERCIGWATGTVVGGDASLRLDGHVRFRDEQQY
jgi:hypothetical protein